MRTTLRSAGAAVVVAMAMAAAPAEGLTAVKPYAVGLGEYQTVPILSVGDIVPETGRTGRTYQMVGIPDGTGAHLGQGVGVLYVNHELGQSAQSQPVVGGPVNRGAFVSRFVLGREGVVSGRRAYDTVHVENGPAQPAAEVGNATRAFGRFCSAFLAGPEVGFDRQIFMTNEEASGGETFDARGGSSVAVYDNQAHTLPKLGFFAKEDDIVAPGTGDKTVVFSLEDGPAGPQSQLYMYVGTKSRSASSVLSRNGLDNGKLYAFVSTNPAHTTEENFTGGSTPGRWAEIPDAENLATAQLESAADAAGALGFVRIEDGAFSKSNPGEFFFVTTGDAGSAHNKLGRLYRLRVNPSDPTGPATLDVIYSADQVIAGGGDIAISPDNIDTNAQYLMIQEDGTGASRPVMGSKGRDGSIWRLDINHGFAATRVAQLNPPGRDGAPVGPGVWETSGIIDLTRLGSYNSWLFDVQAHPPTSAPAPGTVEDGQIALLRPPGSGPAFPALLPTATILQLGLG